MPILWSATQAFLLTGTLFLLPVFLIDTAWSYGPFRDKMRSAIGFDQGTKAR